MEDYCSFETSKLLKEKGFDWVCNSYYTNLGRVFNHFCCHYFADDEHDKIDILTETLRPTHQMAMKWLREQGIDIIILPVLKNEYNKQKYYIWQTIDRKDKASTYEDAAESAIKYVLEKFEEPKEDKDMIVQEEIPYTEEEVKAIIRQNEELRKKYDNALEKAKELMNKGYDVLMPEIFSELQEQESKDERIVRCLLNYFNHVRYNGLDLKGTDVDEVIAWLEKQSDKKPKTWCAEDEQNLNVVLSFIEDEYLRRWLKDKLCYDMEDILPLEVCRQVYQIAMDCGKTFEQSFALLSATQKAYRRGKEDTKKELKTLEDNKPKFKVRDFIANDYCSGKVIEITNDAYLLDTGQGIPLSCEHNAHLWTIEDAKDGDVLCYETKNDFKIFIYKQGHIHYHCCYSNGHLTPVDSFFILQKHLLCYIHPATKEQRDMLFHKMKEEGYEWDPKKKEVKMIEQNTEDKVEPKFKPGDWIIFNGLILHIDEVVNGYYNGYYRTTSRGDGIHNSYNWNIDNAARLWTIADAKDGDVLCYETKNDFKIFIYKQGHIHYHCCYSNGHLTPVDSFFTLQKHLLCYIQPATQEQRDLLFSKMKEKGYEWNAEKKTIEQNIADKTESKFKVGNWYQCTKDFFGKGVTFDKGTAYYCAKEGCLLDGCHIAIVKDLYDNFKLWTIEDAKDGDVLTANVQRGELGYDDYPFSYIPITFIYRKTNNDDYYIHSHCDMCFDGILKASNRIFAKDFIRDICPATKEQRDLLFQKIKEEGYEWDNEKKELKRIEQKSVDNVEPKFHEDDWITNGCLTCKVLSVTGNSYELHLHNDDYCHFETDIQSVNKYYHLWTIKDAKDGDVLNSPSHRLIWIYKDNEHYHDCINMNYVTNNIATDGLIKIPSDACPATKDERTILFEKMKEAGYEWNADKKELKKIEQKSDDKVEPQFKPGDWISNGRYVKKVIGINNDWPYYMFQDGSSYRIKEVDTKWHIIPNMDELEWLDAETDEDHCYSCELFDRKNNMCKCITLCKDLHNTYKGFYIR